MTPTPCAHIGELKWNPAVFGYQMETGDDLTFDERDSAPYMPKCMVVDPEFDWRGQPGRTAVPWDDTIIYELHVRGYTKLHPGSTGVERGTYAGLATEEVIELHQVTRRHVGRIAADSYLCQ